MSERRAGFSQSEGIRIAWESRGEGPHRFVLVPFLGVFGRSALDAFPGLRSTLGALTREGRVTVYDPRGTGQSSPGPVKPTLGDLAEDLQNVILQSESRPAWLLAHFDASGPALHLAATRPDLVAGILFDSGMVRFGAADGYTEGVLHAQATALEEEFNTDPVAALVAFLEHHYGLSTESAKNIVEHVTSQLDDERRKRLITFFLTFDARPALSRCIVPAMVAQGDRDSVIPTSAARFLTTNLANAEFDLMEGHPHFLLNTSGREWFATAMRFIRRKSTVH